ncbi:MAG: PEP-CTERM sorting domain-containing protein [Verrucomicrobiia bacterium]|jgi:hypothetical protein
MKTRSLALPLVVLALFAFAAFPTRSQTVLTFDDLSETGSGTYLGEYGGLSWSGIGCNNAILWTNIWASMPGSAGTAATNGLTGNFYGMVSASNVADVIGTGEIDSPGTNFNFYSVYLTGWINSNLNVRVQGFSDTNLVYDETKVVAATYPTLFNFDYLDINRLTFTCSGGQVAFGLYPYENAVMDNFEFEFIPEPSSLPLAALGAVSLVAFLRRKRA